MQTHQLKTWPALFQAILENKKTFDLRQNDRNFQVGDFLKLREYDPNHNIYTSRSLIKKVTFMIEGEWGLKPGYCAMGLASPGLLAYVAEFKDEGWVMLVHAETRNKAKWNFLRWNPSGYDWESYIYVRLRRLPKADNIPFTFESAAAAGFWYSEEEDGKEEPSPENFINDCQCPLCKLDGIGFKK
jgi:hypothetical protein